MRLLSVMILLGLVLSARAQTQVELETTTIKGNTELPKFLYVVPWQDRKSDQKLDQKLVLHNLYGDLFDPQLPRYIDASEYRLTAEEEP
jgi:hypothetical protein